MSDVYVECLIQAKASPLGKFFKFILIAVAVVLGIMSVGGILVAVLGAVAAGVGAYFVHLNTDIEYEYLYLDKELSVDKVMAKSKRKSCGSLFTRCCRYNKGKSFSFYGFFDCRMEKATLLGL